MRKIVNKSTFTEQHNARHWDRRVKRQLSKLARQIVRCQIREYTSGGDKKEE
jgi:hypothetical protein